MATTETPGSKPSAGGISDDSVWILGTDMTRFARYPDLDVVDLAAEASIAALEDGGVTIHDIDVLAAGSLFNAGTGIGQRLQKQIGQTGIPVFNVANACATGATAVRTVYLSIKAGEAALGLAVGVEQMGKMGLLGGAGAKKEKKVFEPGGRYGAVTGIDGYIGTEGMPGVFAQAGMEYAGSYDGVGFEQFARVAYKNHLHSTLNPLAQYRKEFSLEEIMTSPTMSYPNTLLMCCPTGDGAAAARDDRDRGEAGAAQAGDPVRRRLQHLCALDRFSRRRCGERGRVPAARPPQPG